MSENSPSKSVSLPGIHNTSNHNLSNKNLHNFTSLGVGSTSSKNHDRTYSLDSSAGDSDGPSISLRAFKYNSSEVALSSRQLQQLFPYHISVDKEFNVVQMGEKLYPLVRLILSPNSNNKRINQHISKYFRIITPSCVTNNWDPKILANLHNYSPSSSGLVEIELVNPRSPRFGDDAQRLVLKGSFHDLGAFSSSLRGNHTSSQHAIIREDEDNEDESESSGKAANGVEGDIAGTYLFLLFPNNPMPSSTGEDPYAHFAAACANGSSVRTSSVQRDTSSDSASQEIIAKLRAANATLVAENERLKEDATRNDMRGMIGNVAHDLKTPLAAFMGGVELINDMARDCETILTAEQQDIAMSLSQMSNGGGNDNSNGRGVNSAAETEHKLRLVADLRAALMGISQQAVGVRDINQFMTMTINRCIDYTKASQGIKLVPHNETINLTEVLAMPINCMIASQSKVAFRLHNPPVDICTHVITDKIWLQENMLCLLSNAAKYSNAGRVDIKISLFPAQVLDEAADRAAIILNAMAATTAGSHKTEARPATENIVGPLSAKQVHTIHNQRQERASASSPTHHNTTNNNHTSHRESSRPARNASGGGTTAACTKLRSSSIGSGHSSSSGRRSAQVPVPGNSSSKVLSPVHHQRSTISGSIDVSVLHDSNNNSHHNNINNSNNSSRGALAVQIPHNGASPVAGSKEEGKGSPERNNRQSTGKMESRPRTGTITDPLSQPPKFDDDYFVPRTTTGATSSGRSTPKSTAALSPIVHPSNARGHAQAHGHMSSSPSSSSTHYHGNLISTAIGNAMGLIKGRSKNTGNGSPSQSGSGSLTHSQSNSQAQSRTASRSQSAEVVAAEAGITVHSTAPLGKIRMSKAEKIRHSVRGDYDDDLGSLASGITNAVQEDIEAMALRGSFSSDGEGDLDGDRGSMFSDASRSSSRQVSTDSRQFSSDRGGYGRYARDADLLMGSFDENEQSELSAKMTLSQHHLMYPTRDTNNNNVLSYSPSNYSYLASSNLLPNTPVEVFPQSGGGLFMNRPIQKLQLTSQLEKRESSAPSPTHHTGYHTHSTGAALSPLLLVEIEDTGIGLTEANMSKLYNPFMQAQRLAGGTGLGLYSLSKRLDALGGHYGVECRKDGQPGSLFWFAIPYREDADAASSSNDLRGRYQRQGSSRLEDLIMNTQPLLKSLGLLDHGKPTKDTNHHMEAISEAISERHRGMRDSTKSMADPEPSVESAPHSLHCSSHSSSSLRTSTGSVPVFNPSAMQLQGGVYGGGGGDGSGARSPQHASSAPTVPVSVGSNGASPMHFLLVDDSESILKITSMLLTRSGHSVERAENGVIALDKLAASQRPGGRLFDVVLMDLVMPVLDGLEATKRMREIESEDTAELPRHQVIIGLSANGDDDTAQEAYSAGVDRFIEKPFTIQKLLEALQDIQMEGLE